MDVLSLANILKNEDINSPNFRRELKNFEEAIEVNRQQYRKVAKSSKDVTKSCLPYESSLQGFSENLSSFAEFEITRNQTSAVGLALMKFGIVNGEICSLHKEMMRAMNNFMVFPLENSTKEDTRISAKKGYDKCRQNFENIMNKYNKCTVEEEKKWMFKDVEKSRLLLQMETCDLLIRFQEYEVKKEVDFLNNLTEFYNSQLNYFEQVSEVLKGLDTYIKGLVTHIIERRNKFQEEKKLIEETKDKFGAELGQAESELPLVKVVREYVATKSTELSLARNDIVTLLEKTEKEWWKGELNGAVGFFPSDYVIEIPRKNVSVTQQVVTSDLEIEGYLNKRSDNMMKNWQKRWCSIKDGKFFISSSKDVPPNHVMDLQEFTGKKADESTTDKKFTFLLIPRVFSQRSYFLSAGSEEEMQKWVNVVKNATAFALSKGTVDTTTSFNDNPNFRKQVDLGPFIQSLLEIEGNSCCCDCAAPFPMQADETQWIIKNHGIFVCLNCAGVHRQLPVQISRCRSLIMDKIEPHEILLLKGIGNSRSNAVQEYSVHHLKKPSKQTELLQRKHYIESKYLKKEFCAKPIFDLQRQPPPSPEEMLLESIADHQIEQIIKLVAHGATLNGPQGDTDETLPIHKATLSEYIVGIIYLAENGADPNILDKKGLTALHYAVLNNFEDMIRILLRVGASANQKDSKGQTPYELYLSMNPNGKSTEIGKILDRAQDGMSNGDLDENFLAKYWDTIGVDPIQTLSRSMSFSPQEPPVKNLARSNSIPINYDTEEPKNPEPNKSTIIPKRDAPPPPGLKKELPIPVKKDTPPIPSIRKRENTTDSLEIPKKEGGESHADNNSTTNQSNDQIQDQPVKEPNQDTPSPVPKPRVQRDSSFIPKKPVPLPPSKNPPQNPPQNRFTMAPISQKEELEESHSTNSLGTSESVESIQNDSPTNSNPVPPPKKQKPKSFYPGKDSQSALLASELANRFAKESSSESLPSPTTSQQDTSTNVNSLPPPPPPEESPVNESNESNESNENEPPRPPKARGRNSRARAIYSCIAEKADELSFHEGDIFVIVQKNEDGWWRGKIEGTEKEGLFPSNYVEILKSNQE